MKTGSHHRVAARVLAAVPATALATGLILVLGAPSSSGSGTSGQSSGLVPFPAARPAQVASTERGIIARVKPGVVIIDTRLRYDSEAAAGTGMVINPDGLVLTNNHVIEDATSITATVAGKTYQAQVAGYDKADDIALLRESCRARHGCQRCRSATPRWSTSGRRSSPWATPGAARSSPRRQGKVAKLNLIVTASDRVGSMTSETLHGMMQASAGLVAGDSGGPLSGTNGVIGMDTAASDSGHQQAAGFAIPINTALSVAGQIAAGEASSDITIGYPPFMGTFTGTGSNPNPLGQTRPGQTAAPCPGTVVLHQRHRPHTAARHRPGELRSPGPGRDLRQPRRAGGHDRRRGHHGSERAARQVARRPEPRHGAVPARRHDLRHLDEPGRRADDQPHPPHRGTAAVTCQAGN